MQIKELTTIAEMTAQWEMIQHLYPEMTLQRYQTHLTAMIPNNYQQVAVFDHDLCVGLTGFWFNTKLWTGKYLEIDNFIVHPEHRSKGIGKIITDWIDAKAKELDCTCIVLDAFTGNFTAHRFYYNQGYGPKGFHFVKVLDQNHFAS